MKVPQQDIRKIIRVGNSLAVTIPRGWPRYFRLTERDQVTVLSNGEITIRPLKVAKHAPE